MQKYLAKRLLYAIPTLLGVTVVIFILMHALPGDPLSVYVTETEVLALTPEQRALLMQKLGLDRPLGVQYGSWIGNLLTGNLGESLHGKVSIADMMSRRAPISAEIGVLSVLLAWLIGLPVGILSALRPQTVIDGIASSSTVLFLAIPGFWMGMLIVVALVSWFGYKAPITVVSLWEDPWANLQIIIGPAVVLAVGQAAVIARMARSSLFEVLHEDYVRTARAKGLNERLVLVRHALRNSLLPTLTISAILLAFLLGGSVAVEQAFTAPGLGTVLVSAAREQDINIVETLTLFYAAIFVIVNLGVDVLYGWLDPRIRLA